MRAHAYDIKTFFRLQKYEDSVLIAKTCIKMQAHRRDEGAFKRDVI